MSKFKKLTIFILFIIATACSKDDLNVPIQTIEVSGSNISDGNAKQFSAVILPENASNKNVSWRVTNTAVASISESGLLTPLANGSVTVSAVAKDGSGILGQKTITISGVKSSSNPIQSISITGGDITDGNPKQLTLTILPADASNKTVLWEVSSTATATISSSGLVTPKINGTVTVTATATDGSGKTGQLQLNISGITTVYTQTLKAENILLWQRNNGGWGKAVPDFAQYSREQTDTEKATALSTKNSTDTTIDNGHITTELRDLLTAYKSTNNPYYLAAAEKAIDYLFLAQYENGGWPQYYPDRSGYRHQITYNDNALVNVMNLMWDIIKSKNNLDLVNVKYKEKATVSFNKGIEIILKTQITSNGKKTAWCAQHDEVTLLPETARTYELPSISGSESVGIVRTLMLVEQPSAAIKQAVKDAVDWFNVAKIVGYTTQKVYDSSYPLGYDIVVVPSAGNIMWARFYDLNTGLPFFCGRDGIKKNTLAEIDYERRTGYAWYGNWPSGLIGSEYSNWKTKHGL